MKLYNIVLDTESEKQNALKAFRELNILYHVSGYGNGYYIGIETDIAPEWVELKLIEKGVI